MRKKIIAANWKMNKNLTEANNFITFLIEKMPETDAEILIAPSFTNLYHAYETSREGKIEIVAQNMHQEKEGAYTGEVSADMLKSVGVKRVILGHSERRQYFQENDELLASKVKAALANDMKVIFCIGEKLKDRKKDDHFEVVRNQLTNGLLHLKKEEWKSVVIAYEPVWAIGTGETASPKQANKMHEFIRHIIRDKYGNNVSDSVSILYGGSVKPENAAELFSKPDIDGALVGGAALEVESFVKIIEAV